MEATTTPVRSCHVTRDMLRGWGLEVRDCKTGHGTVTTGPDFGEAVHEAWKLGLVSMSTHRPEERTWLGPNPGARPAWL